MRADACLDTLRTFQHTYVDKGITLITHEDLPALAHRDDLHLDDMTSSWSHALFLPARVKDATPSHPLRDILGTISASLRDACFYACHDNSGITRFELRQGILRLTFVRSAISTTLAIEKSIRPTLQYLQRHPNLGEVVFPQCTSCGEHFDMPHPPAPMCSTCIHWEIISQIPKAALDEVVEHLGQHRRIHAIHALRNSSPKKLMLGEAMELTQLMQNLLGENEPTES